jgi:hypothetical protein
MTSYTLTDEELVFLDGHCSAKIQAEVDAAKQRLAVKVQLTGMPDNEATFIARVVEEARTNGILVHYRGYLRHCDVCNAYMTYVKYKSGRQKGRDNPKKPIKLWGVELAERFVYVHEHATVGCCLRCLDKLTPALKAALAEIRAELPPSLCDVQHYKKYKLMHCIMCDWRGHEGLMGKLPALMGGWYFGACPACPAKNTPFGPTLIETEKGFEVVEVAARDKVAE